MCVVGFSLLLSLDAYIDGGGCLSLPPPGVISRAPSLNRLSLHHVTAYGSDKRAMMGVLERNAQRGGCMLSVSYAAAVVAVVV